MPGRASEPGNTAGLIPEVGALIGVISTRTPWRVFRVDDVHQANWTDQTRAVWERAGSPPWETWAGRERNVGVEPPRNPSPSGKDRRGLRLCPWWSGEQWLPLTDPYPTCVDCGLLWPCPCDDRNREADAAMAEVERLARIMPGCCWACNEPVTGRHHSIVFDGENLLLPGAGPAVFHTSYSRKAASGPSGAQTCRGEAEKYEERWVLAQAGRAVRLRCSGVEWRHYEGVRECSEGDACPGDRASHRTYEHCTTRCLGAGRTFYHGADLGEPEAHETRPASNCGGKGCRGPKPVGMPDDPGVRTDRKAGGVGT
jgi:hypothetical protein